MSGLTERQGFATTPDISLWVGASAGTGKTHVLTARVLRMMVRGTAPDHILCLTYTKAAAAEMANRIYRTLGRWAVIKDSELEAAISTTAGESPDPKMLGRARTLFATVLDIPGGLKIQTIHSFCQTLLKRFPLEAGLSPHFTVMDDRTRAEFLRTTIDDVMLGALNGTDPRLKQAFDHIADTAVESGFEDVINAALAKRRNLLKLLRKYSGPDGVISAVYMTLGADPNLKADDILKAALQDQSFDETGLKRLSKITQSGSDKEKKYGEILIEFLAIKENRSALFPDYRNIFMTQAGTPRKAVLRKATLEAHPAMEVVIEAEKARLVALQDALNLQQVAEDNRALIYLTGKILNQFQKTKEAYGFLDYDDLILKTSELLAREGIAPWILYKLDGGIDHILVDEAQDTNQIQWQLVEKLSDEFFTGLGGREGILRTVFAVGDIKQSIFRFQGAEPEEFEAAHLRIRKKAIDAKLTLENVSLNLSFRSTEAVLKVVDSTFAQPERRPGVAFGDERISHEARRVGHHGLVEVWPPEQKIQQDPSPPGWVLPREQKFSTTPEARLAEKIAGHIETMTGGKETLESRGRAIRYGDILVLVQTRTAFLDHLIRELKIRKIPVAGSDRMVLADQLVVQDLLALVQFVLLPSDDYTLAAVLKGPLINLAEEDLFDLAHGRKGSLWDALKADAKKSPALKAALAFLRPLMALADFTTPYNFFAEVLGPKQGRKLFIRRLGSEIQDPLDEFLSVSLEFEKTHSPSLQGFLKWFSADKSQIKRDMESGKDEVRIMTVHGAKGLQAPIVYLPDTFKPATKKRESLLKIPPQISAPNDPENLLVWVRKKDLEVGPLAAAAETAHNEKEAEHNRLLYVALTRAEDRLYISGWTGKTMPKGDTWYSSIRAAIAGLDEVEAIEGDHELPMLRLEGAQTRGAEPDQADRAQRPEAIALKDWTSKPAKPEAGITGVLQPSRAVEGESKFGAGPHKDQDQALQKGNIIHKLLEVLPDVPEKTQETRALSYLATPRFSLSKESQKEIWGAVSKVLHHPEFAEIFGAGSRAEVSLVGVVDDKFVSAQIDRLIVKKEDVLIVDYKSNRTIPKSSKDVSEAYLTQLGLYARLIKEVYPGRNVRAALLWTEECSLMEIPADIIKK